MVVVVVVVVVVMVVVVIVGVVACDVERHKMELIVVAALSCCV